MKKIIIVALALVLFVSLGFLYKYLSAKNNQIINSSKEGIAKVVPLSVNVMIADTSASELTMTFPASVIARESVTITSEIAGMIRSVTFRDGQNVSKGQIIATIDKREVNAEIDKRNSLLKYLESKFERQKQLFQKNGISAETLELLQSEIDQLKAETTLFEIRKMKMDIKVPFSGTISSKLISSGSYVTTGTAIATVYSTNDLLLEFQVTERLSNLVSKGKAIEVRFPSLNKQHSGFIESINPALQAETNSLTVRAKLKNSQNIYIGSTADVLIERRKINSIKVPTSAIVGNNNTSNVFIVKNGLALSVKVSTGFRTAFDIEIIEGLSIGDTVITTGLPYLKSKMPVSIKFIEGV